MSKKTRGKGKKVRAIENALKAGEISAQAAAEKLLQRKLGKQRGSRPERLKEAHAWQGNRAQRREHLQPKSETEVL